jgi:8-oxo-dGTP diphosphatase
MKVVTAAIIFSDQKVLLTRRGPSEKLAGFWEFPGGKVEDEETKRHLRTAYAVNCTKNWVLMRSSGK